MKYVGMTFKAVARLLGRKWKYSHVDPDVKSRELGTALNLLEKAGLVYRALHSSANGLPLGAQVNPKRFKVFFVDVGLCQRLLGLPLSQLYLERKDLFSHRGGIAEQFVAQELASLTPPNQTPQLYYWHREEKSAQAEVDFLVEHGPGILPLEVKSADEGRLKSLHLFLKEKEKYVQKAFKISTSNFGRHEKVVSLPFYALLQLKAEDLFES